MELLDEVAMVDTAAEIIGSAVALDDLGLFDSKIYSTPVAVGGGTFKILSRHSFKPCSSNIGYTSIEEFSVFGWSYRSRACNANWCLYFS